MKKLKLLLITTSLLLITNLLYAQNVYIPDTNFKNYLLSRTDSINIDNDINNISINEAKNFNGNITINDKSITSLIGIEYFSNIKNLNINNNILQTLDISKNINLLYLSCNNNFISYIDLSKNTKLSYIDCSNNLIKIINFNNNNLINYINCNNNQLTSLDVSNITKLNYLYTINNNILCIAISNNQLEQKSIWNKDNKASYGQDCFNTDKYNYILDNIVYNELKDIIKGEYYQGIQIIRQDDGDYDVFKKLY
jgi:hypothetical protein